VKVTPTAIPEVLIIEPEVHRDERGFFLESWREDRMAAEGVAARFIQDNHSHSVQGTLRGLHYQLERPQGKLVRVVSGEVFDVAVDLRRSSSTFGRWVSGTLSSTNNQQLWIPPGFAHGFYVLSESADLLYKCTEYYLPVHDRTVKWDDSELGIPWPLIAGRPPLVSAKDARAPDLRESATYP
jgi:dTDP-4-dehydrorhamnose 3,5-epimerase